ncbi:MAG TPA: ABC transporter ATP-binding protein [Cyclobacteriaceae bacterium]|nr:ABC transporter ATP-binding protein [Cyclobacteriaceae bacterium]
MNYHIETKGLNFAFTPSQRTLVDLNLNVEKGSIYGFLGPNGAGKTTTIRLLVGLLKDPTHSIFLFGSPLFNQRVSILKRIGSLIEQPSLYAHLSAKDNLEIYRLVYACAKRRIEEVLEIVGLQKNKRQMVKTFSLGMKQRLAIAIALLHDPELLILDEPTNGLDPEGIVEIRALLKKLNKEFEKTILVSSHLLSEVEKVASHVGIIHRGRLLFQGTREMLLKKKSAVVHLELEPSDMHIARSLFENKFSLKQLNESTVQIKDASKEQIPALVELLVDKKVRVYNIGHQQTNLEELFLQITSA